MFRLRSIFGLNKQRWQTAPPPLLRKTIASISSGYRHSFPLSAKKNKESFEDLERILAKEGSRFTAVRLGGGKGNKGNNNSGNSRGDDNEVDHLPFLEGMKEEDMDDRLQEANEWVTMQLSDEDANFLNKKLGIDQELLSAEYDDDTDDVDKKGGNRKQLKTKTRSTMNSKGIQRSKLVSSLINEEEVMLRNLRGFLQINPFICSGCGAAFQTKTENNPGYLPKEKFQEHRERAELIRQKQEAIRILELADVELDSDAAVEFLRNANVPEAVIQGVHQIGRQLRGGAKKDAKPKQVSSPLPVKEGGLDDEPQGETEIEPSISTGEGLEEKICICQRCFRLQQYGKVESALRPGWSENDLLTPERFEALLGSIKNMKTVVLSVVDIFDLEGSVLNNLKTIAGDNPVIIAANKADLLPGDVSESRIINAIYDEVKERCRFWSPSDYEAKHPYAAKIQEGKGILSRSNIVLISCQGGYGLDKLMSLLMKTARGNGNTIHVLGAANAGKSSFINRLLEPPRGKDNGSKKSTNPLVTVSNLPGTTLDFLKIKLPNGITVVDTPGLISRGHLTSKLTTEELKQVIPSKSVKPVTLRLEENKCILLGGLARIELLEGKPMFFTIFASPSVKIHLTDSSKAEKFIETHIGKLIFPPENMERLEAIGPFEAKDFEVTGLGWKKSDYDIVLPGLGWIAVTGPGTVKVRVTAPKDMIVSTRPSLLPYEAKYSTAKYTGAKISQKSGKADKKNGRWKSSSQSSQSKDQI
eukprot:gene3222-3528_t